MQLLVSALRRAVQKQKEPEKEEEEEEAPPPPKTSSGAKVVKMDLKPETKRESYTREEVEAEILDMQKRRAFYGQLLKEMQKKCNEQDCVALLLPLPLIAPGISVIVVLVARACIIIIIIGVPRCTCVCCIFRTVSRFGKFCGSK